MSSQKIDNEKGDKINTNEYLRSLVEKFGSLWICPECGEGNKKIGICSGCNYLGIKIASENLADLSLEKDNKKNKERFWNRLGIALVVSIFGLVVIGAPIGISTTSFWYEQYYPSPKPTPSPTQTPSLTPIVEEALKQYLQTNWNGWNYTGYDDTSTYLTENEGEITAYIEKDGHSITLSFKTRLLISNEKQTWLIIPTDQAVGN